MAITVACADVKRKVMIPSSDVSFDAMINALIAETVPVISYTIEDKYLSASDSNLAATLNLGALEIVAGDFIEQIIRDVGYKEDFSIPGLTMGGSTLSGEKLIEQGWERLKPYLKSVTGMMNESLRSITSAGEDDFIFRGDRW